MLRHVLVVEYNLLYTNNLYNRCAINISVCVRMYTKCTYVH